MQAFLAELKRRKVSRVALAYVAGAWAVLQVADIVFPLMELPAWSMRMALMISAVGFPIAVTISWFFDVSSAGVTRTEEAPPLQRPQLSTFQALQMLLTGVLALTVGYLYYERLSSTDAPRSSSSTAPLIQSIAVLPFANMSDDPSNVYFSDGMSEELLNVLAQVRGLRVAARTSSFLYRNSSVDAIAIGRRLGVAMLLEGSVRKIDDRVRVTAQLIDTSNGFHLWSETYDAKLQDVFVLQENIARRVVKSIRPVMLEADGLPEVTSTQNFEAYNEYLKGRAALRKPWRDSSLHSAEQRFKRAIELDAEYSDAYAGLCDTYLADYAHNRVAESFARAEQSCQRALTRSPSGAANTNIQIALGVLFREAGAYEKSEDVLRQVQSEHPLMVRPKKELGMTLAGAGRRAEAEAILEQAISLDESDWDSWLVLANYYLGIESYPEARGAYEKLLALRENSITGLTGLGSALYMQGERSRAEQVWQRAASLALSRDSGSLAVIYSNLGLLYYYGGDYHSALKMYQSAAEIIGEDHEVWGRIAETNRALGNREAEHQSYAVAIGLAQDQLGRNPNSVQTLGLLALYEAHSGQRKEALDHLKRMQSQQALSSVSSYFAALIYWALGDVEPAFRAVGSAVEQGFSPRLISEDPDLQQLRLQDPERFDALVRPNKS